MKAKILFTGGGTGGHLMPVLAVMEAVQSDERSSDIECLYAGLKSDVHSEAIRTSKLRFTTAVIRSGKLNRFLTWKHLVQSAGFAVGLVQAEALIARTRPNVVFAKGGFVGVPIILAAARRKIPIFCHESDATLGLANRIASRYATRLFTAYPAEAYPEALRAKIRPVGQPVRSEFYAPAGENPLVIGGSQLGNLPIVTVIGGSQGARRVNELVQGAWADLLDGSLKLVHICGPNNYAELAAAAEKLSQEQRERLVLVPFVAAELPELFKRSTLVVSRAGGTVAELAAARVPSILIPLSTAAQDHQAANAKLLADAGAALVLDELAATSSDLMESVRKLLNDMELRSGLSSAIAEFARPSAAADMAGELIGEALRQ